jgi:hypothetical protein
VGAVDVGEWLVERRADMDRAEAVKIVRGGEGTGRVVITLGDVEVEEFAAALQAFLELRYRPAAVDGSSGGDSPAGEDAPIDAPSRSALKAHAFMDLVRTALAHADRGRVAGADRYLVHLVSRHGGRYLSRLDGTPVRPGDAAMLHHGYRVEGDPNHQLSFYRPDVTYLGTTHPAHARRPSA